MLCPKDNGGFRWRRNRVRRRSAAENRQRGRWWRSRAGGRKDTRRFVMRGTPRPLSVVLRGRVRALRQRPGAMAHLHGGRMICVRSLPVRACGSPTQATAAARPRGGFCGFVSSGHSWRQSRSGRARCATCGHPQSTRWMIGRAGNLRLHAMMALAGREASLARLIAGGTRPLR